MRRDKLKQRRKEKALETLKQLGFDPTAYEITTAEELDEEPNNLERQGEAALAFLSKPSRFTTKQCLYCEEYFGTNYNSVGYCSNQCRNKHFQQQTGLTVDWGRKNDRERWLGNEPPLVIDPFTLKMLAAHYEAMQKERLNPQDSQTRNHQEVVENFLTIQDQANRQQVQTNQPPEPEPTFDFSQGDLDAFFDSP